MTITVTTDSTFIPTCEEGNRHLEVRVGNIAADATNPPKGVRTSRQSRKEETVNMAATADLGDGPRGLTSRPWSRYQDRSQVPPDVGEFNWIREAPVPHHLAQSAHPRTREEQPRNVG